MKRVRILPDRSADAALRPLVLELPRQARAPADAVVGADHVGHRRARLRRLEAVGLRHHVGDLIAAPAVALDADRVLIHEALIHHRLDRRQHALQRALAGIAGGVDDVRRQHQVAVADVVADVDRRARRADSRSGSRSASASRRCRPSSGTSSWGRNSPACRAPPATARRRRSCNAPVRTFPTAICAFCGLASLTLRSSLKLPSVVTRSGNSVEGLRGEQVDVGVLGLHRRA